MKTVRDFDFQGKKVLVRCDFNVPLNEKGGIFDDFRIQQTISTIEYLRERKAKLILISHLGRPEKIAEEKERKKKLTLKPVAKRLSKLLGESVRFLPSCTDGEVENEVAKMAAGEVILLENLRFYKEEKENDPNFAKKLAQLADIYINDAFAVSHRTHASIVGVPKYLPSGGGPLLVREAKILSKVLKQPWSPLVAIIGGMKIKTKIGAIELFLEKADHVLLGGDIANVFLREKGISLLGTPPESEILEKIEKIQLTNPKLHLPIDSVISLKDMERGFKEGYFRKAAPGLVRKEEGIYDIGPETIAIFSRIIGAAKMIFWNGPMGVFEKEPFAEGTKKIAQAIVKNHSAFRIVGGGDTVSAISEFDLRDKFDHVSTGGGAMLELLSGKKLPGLEALKR